MKRRNYIHKYSENDYAVFFDKLDLNTKHFKTEIGAKKYLERMEEKYSKPVDLMALLGYKK